MVGSAFVRRAALSALLATLSALASAPAVFAASSISGTVTGPSSAPLPQICAEARGRPSGAPTASATTNAAGSYSIGGLTAGDYDLSFKDCSGSGDYATEYYDNAIGAVSSTRLTVDGANALTGINAQMAVAGKISGTVRDPGGSPIAGVCVTTNSALGQTDGGSTATDALGQYTIAGLQPGSYRIGFATCPADIVWIQQWFDHKTNSLEATLLAVTSGQTQRPPDIILAPSGNFPGLTFTASADEPFAGTPDAAYPVQVTAALTQHPKFSGGPAGPSAITLHFGPGLRLGAEPGSPGCATIDLPLPPSGPPPTCPPGSQVGTGFITQALTFQEIPAEFTAYNNTSGDGLLIMFRGLGQQVLTGTLDADHSSLTIPFSSDMAFGYHWGLTAFSLTLGATATQATSDDHLGWVRSASCPGAWPIAVDLAATTGAQVHAATSVSCSQTPTPWSRRPPPPTPQPPAPVVRATVHLRGSKTLAARAGLLRVRCHTSGPKLTSCRVTISVQSGRSRTVIARGSQTGGAGEHTVTATLTAAGRALLKRHPGPLNATLLTQALAGTSVTASTTTAVTVRSPPARH